MSAHPGSVAERSASWSPVRLVSRLCTGRWRGTVDLVASFVRAAREDGINGLAAQVAFFAVLMIFPGLLALAATLGWIGRLLGGDIAEEAQERVTGVLTTFLTERGEGTVEAVTELFEQGAAGALTVGLLGAAWAAGRATSTVLRALAEISDEAETRTRLRRGLVAVGIGLGSVAVVAIMLAMLVLGPLFGLGRGVAGWVGLGDVYAAAWRWAGLPVAFLMLVGWAGVILHAAPHRHLGWRHDLLGAAVTGVLWVAVSLGFRLYLELFGGNPVYGVLGGALVVLLWTYLLSASLLVGAEVNAVRAERRAPPAHAGGVHPVGDSPAPPPGASSST
ncbi:MAG: YihY/virulence factor BrkB family protein [Actinomycetota bacterium]|nr:YihY/virulence factor BrkB family protein [Actinomycetota bacterium]